MLRRFTSAARRGQKKPYEFVSKAFESLDYEYFDNEVASRELDARGKVFIAFSFAIRFAIFVLIGLLSAICGSLIELGVHWGSIIRYGYLVESVDKYFKNNLALLYLVWSISILVPAVLGSLPVIYGEPTASGGGAQWVLGHLNGVDLSSRYTFKAIVIKIVSCALCVVSGLPGGKEAPLIHIGAIVGYLIPSMGFGSFRPLNYFLENHERRDMAAAGTAAGLTAAFSTPIAGIILTFEESLSYWNLELTFLIFICAISSYIMLTSIIQIFISGCPACITEKMSLFLRVHHEFEENFYILEIFSFILLGAMGGLLGAFWNAFQKRMIRTRKSFITSEVRRFIEIVFISIANAVIQLTFIYFFRNYCLESTMIMKDTEELEIPFPELGCKQDDQLPLMGILFFQNPTSVLKNIFADHQETLYGILPLACFGIYYFIASCTLCGSSITHGIFVPQILNGAVWGRLMAEVIQYLFPGSASWARPNKFAFLGGAAQLSGSLQIALTIGMMMLETCNRTNLAIPIFIVVTFSRTLAGIFNESIYHSQCHFAGIPLLDEESPPSVSTIKAKNIMSGGVVDTLPLRPSYALVKDILTRSQHNGFPVVDPVQSSSEGGVTSYGSLKGLILRSQIIALIKTGMQAKDLEDIKSLKNLRTIIREFDPKEVINIDADNNKVINLEPFMNSPPQIINMNSTLNQVYRIFSRLGLRHLVVVNDNLKVVGIITRKDLAIFRHHTHYCFSETSILMTK